MHLRTDVHMSESWRPKLHNILFNMVMHVFIWLIVFTCTCNSDLTQEGTSEKLNMLTVTLCYCVIFLILS